MFSAILITGGLYTDDSAEVFLPATSTSCLVSASLVVGRDGLLVCLYYVMTS